MELSNILNRRDWLGTAALGVVGSSSGWMHTLAAAAKRPKKSVILLWLNGGPSTIDLWDMKPGHANGGPFRAIRTPAAGLQLSEHLPKLAALGSQLALVRSMTSQEGDHGRAAVFVRTGYTPQGGILFPVLGSLVAHALYDPANDLPGFVSIAVPRFATAPGGGFLGPRFGPLTIGSGATSPDGLTVPYLRRMTGVTKMAQVSRFQLLQKLETLAVKKRPGAIADAARAATDSAARLMQPSATETFFLEHEDTKLRDAYGRTVFGQGCLLARRLVEKGVSFVEVSLDGWDTHLNNFEQIKGLCATLDAGFAALLADLQSRGLLDSTLVVCMGEFGRTPKINGANGRDHWPQAWSVALAGGGVPGGQVIGKTSADGSAVTDHPVTVPDLIATICTAIGIDPSGQNPSNVGRPIRVADPAAKPIQELL
ncbi:MAG: DUF1501 domain-containing protein [Bacteroidales bacterium]|nr:DUF1501 domain-containing protein [Bacteroidales bacterium]